MQDASVSFDPDLADLPRGEWLTQLAGVAEDFGFFQPLGRKHFAAHVRRGDTLMVSFETIQGIRALSDSAEPLGWSMVREHGWSHLCIASDGDTWFRDRNVIGLFDRMIDDGFFDDFETILFYGAGPCVRVISPRGTAMRPTCWMPATRPISFMIRSRRWMQCMRPCSPARA